MPTVDLNRNPSIPREGSPGASRASWCGSLQLGGRSVPVKAYPAIATPPSSPMKQFHTGCGQRIQQPRWCAQHGVVPDAEIAKGYEYGLGDLVELSETELASLRVEEDKTLQLERFFPPDDLDLVLLSGRSLFLSPAHDAATADYAVVWGALRESALWGFGRMVLSHHRQPVIVRPGSSAMLLHVLHWPDQRRRCPMTRPADLTAPRQEAITEVLGQLRRHVAPVDWESLVDEAPRRLAALVQAKVAARSASLESPVRRKPRSSRKGRTANEPHRRAA